MVLRDQARYSIGPLAKAAVGQPFAVAFARAHLEACRPSPTAPTDFLTNLETGASLCAAH
jgi:hypothetical protein